MDQRVGAFRTFLVVTGRDGGWGDPVLRDALRAADIAVQTARFAEDAQGHEHAGKGPHGGQFVAKGKGGSEKEDSSGDQRTSEEESSATGIGSNGLATAEEVEDATEEVKPDKVLPVHGIKDESKLESLVESMRENGWQGRPLLVVDTGEQYQGWTGSHRLVAAQEAELDEIPVVVVTWDELTKAADDLGENIFSLLDRLNDDDDKMAFLEEAGLNVAAELMREEQKKNLGDRDDFAEYLRQFDEAFESKHKRGQGGEFQSTGAHGLAAPAPGSRVPESTSGKRAEASRLLKDLKEKHAAAKLGYQKRELAARMENMERYLGGLPPDEAPAGAKPGHALAARLDALPAVAGRPPDTRGHGLPVEMNPPYRGNPSDDDLARAPVQDVPVGDLIATQVGVSRQHLADKIKEGGGGKPVMLVRAGGKLYIQDGTHQAALSKLRGDATVKAQVFDYDPERKRPVLRPSDEAPDEIGRKETLAGIHGLPGPSAPPEEHESFWANAPHDEKHEAAAKKRLEFLDDHLRHLGHAKTEAEHNLRDFPGDADRYRRNLESVGRQAADIERQRNVIGGWATGKQPTAPPGPPETKPASAPPAATPPASSTAPAKAVPTDSDNLLPNEPGGLYAPKLTGTPAMIRAATSIRQAKASEAKALYERAKTEALAKGNKPLADQLDRAFRRLVSQSDAAFYLDRKNTSGGDLLRQVWKESYGGFSEQFPDPPHRSASELRKLRQEAERFAEDASGHEHKGKGAGGGQFVGKGKGGLATKETKRTEAGANKKGADSATSGSGDPAANRPSKPTERHKGSRPEPLPWRAPPPKKPKPPDAGKFVRPKGDESQTALGDHTELLATKLGFRNILPAGKRTAAGTEDKKGSIDTEFDHSGRAYELKMCKTTSTEYRLKAKKDEKDAKLAYAEKYKLKPYTLVAVRDVDRNECHFYAGKQPGLIGAEVNDRDYDFVGTIKF